MIIDEIIEILSDQKQNLVGAFLKTKVFLHKIERKELTAWINRELQGYGENDTIPDYRIVPSRVLANIANPAVRYTRHPVPIGHLSTEQQDSLYKTQLPQPIAGLEEMTAGASEGGYISRPIAMEFNGLLGKQLGNGYHIEQAWAESSQADVKSVLVNIRSRLLDFMLEIKGQLGDAVDDSDIRDKVRKIDTGSLFEKAIFGPNATINIGDHGTQIVRSTIQKGDWQALSDQLKAHGVPESEVNELKKALDEDEQQQVDPLEGKTGNWLTRLMSKAAKGSIKLSKDVATGVVAKLIVSYMTGGLG
jgi:hypothetical protein